MRYLIIDTTLTKGDSGTEDKHPALDYNGELIGYILSDEGRLAVLSDIYVTGYQDAVEEHVQGYDGVGFDNLKESL